MDLSKVKDFVTIPKDDSSIESGNVDYGMYHGEKYTFVKSLEFLIESHPNNLFRLSAGPVNIALVFKDWDSFDFNPGNVILDHIAVANRYGSLTPDEDKWISSILSDADYKQLIYLTQPHGCPLPEGSEFEEKPEKF